MVDEPQPNTHTWPATSHISPTPLGIVCMGHSTPALWISANTTWYVFNFRARLIRTLLEQGFTVTVVAPADDYVQRVEALGAKHIDLPMAGGANPIRDAWLIMRFWQLLGRHRPAILLSFTPKPNIYGALSARLRGIPVVANIAGLGQAFANENWLRHMIKWLYRLALRRAHVFFQNLEDQAQFVAEHLVEQDRTERLPGSGVDTEHFSPRARRSVPGREKGLPTEKPFTFLMVGRLLRDKGVGEYVEAARQLRADTDNVLFHLLGFIDTRHRGGVTHDDIRSWERDGIIDYLGHSDDVRSHYAQANCVVLPSYYREGVPRTLLEAASMGLPVITTDMAGCRDAVEDGVTGLLVRPRDVDDLVSKMRQMVHMTDDARQRMGSQGRGRMCRDFSEKLVIQRYVDAVRRLGVISNVA